MNDNLIASTNKLSSLIKMIEWHARVADMAKHINKVEGGLGPGPLGPPLNSALRSRIHEAAKRNTAGKINSDKLTETNSDAFTNLFLLGQETIC